MDHGISIQLGSTFLQLYRLPQVASSCPLCRSNVAGSTGFHSDIETTWNDIIGTIASFIGTNIVSWVVVSNIFYLPNSGNFPHFRRQTRAMELFIHGLDNRDFPYKDLVVVQLKQAFITWIHINFHLHGFFPQQKHDRRGLSEGQSVW